ncbi:MAG TPA: hypothetical protein VKU19_18075 [Bryobacteraceae bacterium]|nr:hypothetical protein [Bryobacteraceae bacterium]
MPTCNECLALYHALRETAHDIRQHLPQPPSISLETWIQSLNPGDCAEMRANSRLWEAWRRLREHQSRTGHHVSALPLPPEAISCPN